MPSSSQINGIIDSDHQPKLPRPYANRALTTSRLDGRSTFLAQSNAQGQTILLAAGDTGAADCDNSGNSGIRPITSATQGLAVDYPGSSVYVTDVGGTEFMGDGTSTAPQTGAGTYWSANGSNDLVTSAKSYIPEMTWNDTTFSINNGGGFSAGGGGASALFKKPSWQTGVPNIPADGFRDVPDVSLDTLSTTTAILSAARPSPTEARIPLFPAVNRIASAYRIQARRTIRRSPLPLAELPSLLLSLPGLLVNHRTESCLWRKTGTSVRALQDQLPTRLPMLPPSTTSRPATIKYLAPPVHPTAPAATTR